MEETRDSDLESDTSFGEWVRRRRKAMDLTRAALAERVGCAPITIKKIEREERRPSLPLAELLADRLLIAGSEREAFIRLARGGAIASRVSNPVVIPTLPIPSAADRPSERENPAFVGRQRELASLDAHLSAALAGHGQVVFITGEAGRGKTSLMTEFARRAQAVHPQLIVAGGQCNAYISAGDPYLPFLDVMAILSGDMEAKWAAGNNWPEQKDRLRALLPNTVQALVEQGPDLIGVLVSEAALLKRARAHTLEGAEWLARLESWLERRGARAGSPEQRQLLEQFAQVLRLLATRCPLLILLDDLQWADSASTNLLFHLGRRLAGSRIFILGAYRPSEVAIGQRLDDVEKEDRHPLETVINEFKRFFGDIELDLERFIPEEGQAFVNTLLDRQPNRLGQSFRETLFQHTKGHPLFTEELLREMQARGDLVQDQTGEWIEGKALNWDRLPVRVEAVIAQRINRLPIKLREALKVASVEGEVFTAEVVARVLKVDEAELVRQLSSGLDRRHRLILSQDSRYLGPRRLSRYRFRHILFNTYMVHSLDEVERAYLHEAVAIVLEEWYGENTQEIAVELARHFEQAGRVEKAIGYLYQSAEQAVRLSANEEAIAFLRRGLKLLESLPDTPERARRELAIQTALGVPVIALMHYGAPQVMEIYTRALALCRNLGESPGAPILRALALASILQRKLQQAYEWGEQLLILARQGQDPVLLVEAHYVTGVTLFWLGQFLPARRHLEQAMAAYDSRRHRTHVTLYAQDPGVICLIRLAHVLWVLGYPDQAAHKAQEAVNLAWRLAHPFSLGYTLVFAAWLYIDYRDELSAQAHLEAAISLANEQGFPHWRLIGTILAGWLLCQQGQIEAGIAQIRQAMADYQDTGAELGWPYYLLLLAQAYAKVGKIEQGLAALEDAFEGVEDCGDRWCEAELYRARGDLLLQAAAEDEAGESYLQAMQVARRQGAKSLELRAVVSLSRLWQRQGKQEQARRILADTCGWFTEGFETKDLREAREQLEGLL